MIKVCGIKTCDTSRIYNDLVEILCGALVSDTTHTSAVQSRK